MHIIVKCHTADDVRNVTTVWVAYHYQSEGIVFIPRVPCGILRMAQFCVTALTVPTHN